MKSFRSEIILSIGHDKRRKYKLFFQALKISFSCDEIGLGGKKKTTHSPACLELMIPVYLSKHKSRHFIQLLWLRQHSLSSAPQTQQALFPWTSPLGTFPFTLKLAAFHHSSFKLNVTPLEGPLLTLPSKGNVSLILPLVFPITHLFPS